MTLELGNPERIIVMPCRMYKLSRFTARCIDAHSTVNNSALAFQLHTKKIINNENVKTKNCIIMIIRLLHSYITALSLALIKCILINRTTVISVLFDIKPPVNPEVNLLY